MSAIRPKVVCLLRNGSRLLLIRAHDPHDRRDFLIPPGGGVEFGETLDEAVRREIGEEVGIALADMRRVALFENVFTFAGRPEHELVFVYDAACDDAGLCARDEFVITESNGERLPARWYTLAEIAATGLPLFPAGLLPLLTDPERFSLGPF